MSYHWSPHARTNAGFAILDESNMNEAFANPPEMAIPRFDPVATIAIAQLFGTSLWFSANSAADDLRRAWGASISGIGILTSAREA